MEVSNQSSASGGQALVDSVLDLTGIAKPLIEQELSGILQNSGHVQETLTLEQLRASMLAYLESMKDELFPEEAGEELDEATSSDAATSTS